MLRPLPPVPSEEDGAEREAVRATQDRLRQVERDLARVHDPSAAMFGALADHDGEMFAQRQAAERLTARLEQALERLDNQPPKEVVTQEQIRTLGLYLVQGCGTMVPKLLQMMKWSTIATLICVVVGAFGFGVGVHWWWSTPLKCDLDYAGRQICYRDNGPAPATQQQPTTPGRR